MASRGTIIGGFKAIGKSTLGKKYQNVVDLEITNFQYVIDENLAKLSIEQRKGIEDRKPNPEYPMNYYNEIIRLVNDGKIVLIATKKEIIDLLKQNNIDFYVVWPKEDMLDEIIFRCKKRGNNERFISKIIEVYYRDYPADDQKVFWLQKGQFLEEVLISNGFHLK